MAKIIGQSTALRIMAGIYKSGRLHHAYLFHGEEGVGKFESATNYAKAVLCESESGTYCDKCYHCKNIEAYKHPDVVVLSTDERFTIAELYYTQYIKYGLPHLFLGFYNATRSILYKLESALFDCYDNYPVSAPEAYMLGNRRDTTRNALIEPYYLAVNLTLSSINEKNALDLHPIFNSKSKEAIEIIKNRGGKKKGNIEGDFFDALKKLHYNVIHTVIPLDTVRRVIEMTYRKPSISKRRIIIIEGLELMDGRAPNIFLRTLEEPTDNNVFILISSNPNKLVQDGMKPLLSRVMEIKFSMLSAATLTSILVKRLRLDEGDAALAVMNSDGSVSKGLRFILDKNLNASDNTHRLLTNFVRSLVDNDLTQVVRISAVLCEGGYDVASALLTLTRLFANDLRTRYLGGEGTILPNSVTDESVAWLIDDIDFVLQVISRTNAQQRMAFRKVLSDIYLWLRV